MDNHYSNYCYRLMDLSFKIMPSLEGLFDPGMKQKGVFFIFAELTIIEVYLKENISRPS